MVTPVEITEHVQGTFEIPGRGRVVVLNQPSPPIVIGERVRYERSTYEVIGVESHAIPDGAKPGQKVGLLLTMRSRAVTIIEFLEARIADDEQAARSAAGGAAPTWMVVPQAHRSNQSGIIAATNPERDDITDGWIYEPVVHDEGEPTEDEASHIARWDPARVLADCAARLKLLALHNLVTDWTNRDRQAEGCDHCRTPGLDGDDYIDPGPCPTLLILASAYQGHPDCDPSWAFNPT